MTRRLERESFRAMGTVCTIAATTGPIELTNVRRAIDAARREVAVCEQALSRFGPRSDLSRLNDANGAWVVVDRRLVEALGIALRGRAGTDGLFDPTILPALVAAGYDRSFELLTHRAANSLDAWCAGALIEVDTDSMSARIERGAAVDLGGIGKGYAATRALGAMCASWPALTGALVDLGGDIGVWGSPPEGGPWRVDITDPRADDRVVGTLELTDGGVATSGRDARRFGPGGALHHLIDPATGSPAVAGPLSVTVVAASAAEAEVHATALAVLDVGASRDYLAARRDLAALLIPQLGEPITIGRLPLAPERPRVRIALTTDAGGSSWHR
jgi:thiamine biosynthesis lipoprotein